MFNEDYTFEKLSWKRSDVQNINFSTETTQSISTAICEI